MAPEAPVIPTISRRGFELIAIASTWRTAEQTFDLFLITHRATI
jgi:hypothetical protein